MNTGRLTVENIRSIYGLPTSGPIMLDRDHLAILDLLDEFDLFWPLVRLSYEIADAHTAQRGKDLQSLLDRLQHEIVRIGLADSDRQTIVEASGSVLTEYRAIE